MSTNFWLPLAEILTILDVLLSMSWKYNSVAYRVLIKVRRLSEIAYIQ